MDTQRIIKSDTTRKGMPFDVIHYLEGPKEGQVVADVAPTHRYSMKYTPQHIRAFDKAAQDVQPLLDAEQFGEAVKQLRDVE